MRPEDKEILEAIPCLQQELTVRFQDIRSIAKKYPDDALHQQIAAWQKTSYAASDVLGRASSRLREALGAESRAGQVMGEAEMRRREMAYWAERKQQIEARLNAILQESIATKKQIVAESFKGLEAIEAERRNLRQDYERLNRERQALNLERQRVERELQDAQLESAKADAYYKQARTYQEEAEHIRNEASLSFETGRKYVKAAHFDAKRQEGITKDMNEALVHYRQRLEEAETYKNQQAILRNELQSKSRELDQKIQDYNAKDLELKRRGRYVTEKWREVQASAKGAGVDVSEGIKV